MSGMSIPHVSQSQPMLTDLLYKTAIPFQGRYVQYRNILIIAQAISNSEVLMKSISHLSDQLQSLYKCFFDRIKAVLDKNLVPDDKAKMDPEIPIKKERIISTTWEDLMKVEMDNLVKGFNWPFPN